MIRTIHRRLMIGLLPGLVFASALTTRVFGAGEQSNVPNFSSIDRPWVASEGGEDLLPASGIGPVTYDHAHPVMVRVPIAGGAVAETALRIAAVNNPNLKPWVVDALKKSNQEVLAGKLRWTSRANCWPAGIPEFLPYASPSWHGESVGRYKGDELVVDTVGFIDRTFPDDHYDLPHTTQLHVIERFKLVDYGTRLQVSFTVEDPGAFNEPWSAVVRHQHARMPVTLVEEPCAENNVGHQGNFFQVPVATKTDF
jgi:hypothetical protein